MDRITRGIPDEGKISDKLEEYHEDSILRYVLKYEPKIVKDYCTIDEQGNLLGEYAEYFKQAIRIEGTYKSVGKHAAGVVISRDKLVDVCPMMEDRIVMDMHDIEDLGLVKLDVLGVASLDKCQLVNKLLRYGHL
jgi:DNA polymerase-3 subunit alpha